MPSERTSGRLEKFLVRCGLIHFDVRMVTVWPSEDVISFDDSEFHSNFEIGIGWTCVRLLVTIQETRFEFIATASHRCQIQIVEADLLVRSTTTSFLRNRNQ